jgi:hypothetical protein
MKPIDKQALFKAAREGKADIKQVRELVSQLADEPPPDGPEDKDPAERIADELSRFTESIMAMNKVQAQALATVLHSVLLAVEKIAALKIEVPSAKAPVIDFPERPTAWQVNATRDHRGLIQFPIEVTAKK